MMSGDGEAKRLGEKLLLDVQVEDLSSVCWGGDHVLRMDVDES